jgi:urease accessory protein
MDASARIVVGAALDGRPVVGELVTPAPLGARLSGGALYLLGTAAGPLGGDRLALTLRVTAGASLTVRSAGASLAQRGDGTPSLHTVIVHVEDGAHLVWDVEPLIAAAGCDHRTTATVHLGVGASVVWRDEVVLGRSGEAPGRCRSGLRIERDGAPILDHELSTTLAGWDGPAVTAGAKVVGHLAVVGQPVAPTSVASVRAGWLRLGDDVGLAVALADDHATLRRDLAAAWPPATSRPARPACPTRSVTGG